MAEASEPKTHISQIFPPEAIIRLDAARNASPAPLGSTHDGDIALS